MVGGSPSHNRIIVNLTAELKNHLKGKPCEVSSSDQKVAADAGSFFYPEILVVCGGLDLTGPNNDIIKNPAIVIEVLSSTTESFDRTTKFLR